MTPTHESESAPGAPPAWMRPLLVLLAAVAALLFGTATIIAYHNLRYSYARVLDILGGAASASPGLELTAVDVPAWVDPFLQDLSVVSPALVVFTGARMLVAALLLLAAPLATRRWSSLHFPFPEPYKVYYIQMGLLGTIVGFVLAFAEVDPRAERQSLILLEALGTALWSTLTAIVLAYVVCPVVEAPYRRLRDMLLPREPGDTRSALDLLRARTFAAAEELDVLGAATRALTAASQTLGAELGDRELASRLARVETQVAELVHVAGTLAAAHSELRDRIVALESESASAAQCAQRQQQTLAQQEEQLTAVGSDLAALRRMSEALAAEAPAHRAVRARLDAVDAWLQHAPRPRSAGNGEES